MLFRDELISAAKSFGLELDGGQLDKFEKFFRLVIEQNRTMNLTTITEPRDFAIKHVIDSLSAWDDKIFRGDEKLLDVGTGAGFPAIPLKIFRPQLKMFLIDSLNKRVEFLKRVVTELELDDVEIFHGRAEELARQKFFREQFEIVTSRAVARLNILAEYCLPFVKVGGKFVALKGKNFSEELDEARAAIKILGGGQILIREPKLPLLDESRAVIYVDKKKSTSEKFPRRENLIRNVNLR
ncbi:MAG: 16S rRNA (guanine(527)-N(7))-methyltransferase RsmG [Selenomonadaceae bacterium]|nr:16S rRNA (guanine(527)-N(7))-methyltransferase RsmG [Selenomonadaceae bacterium]